MLSQEQKKIVYDAIPAEYLVKGETLGVQKVYANQWNQKDVPAITLNYTVQSLPRSIPLNDLIWINRNYQDTTLDEAHTFNTGVLIYLLDNPEVIEILEVTGTVGGSPYTFVKDVDYVKNGDAIEFIGTTPDDSTVFDADYKHYMFKYHFGGELTDTLSVNIYAEDDTVSGTFINGIIAADDICNTLRRFFAYASHEILKPENLLLVYWSEVRNLDFLEETVFRRRRQFDVHVAYIEESTAVVGRLAEEPSWEIEIGGVP